MRFLNACIALSSIVLFTGFLELAALAQKFNSTSIYYIVRPDVMVGFIEQAVPTQSNENKDRFINITQFTDLLDSIEIEISIESNQKLNQFNNTAVPSNLIDDLEQVVPTEEEQNLGQSASTVAPTDSLASVEQAVHNQVNQYRTSIGLPPLKLDSRISKQARIHSQNMALGTVAFSHDGFKERVSAIATLIPYSGAAENVAYNQGYDNPATKAVEGWLNSTGLREISHKVNEPYLGGICWQREWSV